MSRKTVLIFVAFSCTALIASAQVASSRVAVVRFNSRGIEGSISFIELDNGDVRIIANLQGLRGFHNWHIHHYPVDQSLDPAIQCRGVQIGGHYDPFGRSDDPNYDAQCAADQNLCEVGDLEGKFGALPESGQVDVVDMTGQLSLTGRYSIVGRPINIHDSIDSSVHLDCGTIRLMEESEGAQVTLLQATFISPIAGTIYMRQVGTRNVEIFGKLYWVNDTESTVQHNWHIHEGQPEEEYRIGVCNITVGGNVGPHYDPTGNGPTSRAGYTTECTPDIPDGCEVGDLTGKHARIDIPARPDPYRNGAFFFTDSFLNLTDVVGRSIVVHVPNGGGPSLACAPLLSSENYTLTAAARRDIQASQSSPFEDTTIIGLGVMGGVTMPLSTNDLTLLSPALGPVSTVCSREDVYSPYDLYTGDGEDTPDRYDLGDWRSRYLNDLVAFNTFNVLDMPVYGANSIAGRTMRSVVGSMRFCTSWIPVLTVPNVLRAKAAFTGSNFGPLEGAIYFFQHDLGNGVLGNTLVVVDVYYEGMDIDTSGHNWHVHENPPVDGQMCEGTIGEHYNPYLVSTGTLDAEEDGDQSMFSDYGEDCSPTYPLRCESGDLAGKHGQIRLTSDGPTRPTYSYFDPDVQLAGDFSIIGRSIGIHVHNLTGLLFDCGQIVPFQFSSTLGVVEINAGEMLRSEFARELTEGTSVDPTDVIIVAQAVTPLQPGSRIECTTFVFRIAGETTEQADENYDEVVNSGNLKKFGCVDPDALVINFINQSPKVQGDTITADIQSNQPIETMRCALTGSPLQNCSSGSVTFTDVEPRDPFNRPYILRVVARMSDGTRAVIRRPVRIEQEGFCGVHFVNDGVFVNGNTAIVEFVAVGKVGSMLCSLDRGPLFPCRSPQVFSGLSPGEHRLKIVPSRDDCGRDRYRIHKTFTMPSLL